MDANPTKRICTSDISVILRKPSRHALGAKKGKIPSSTNNNAQAAKNSWAVTLYLPALPPGCFKYLKKSDDGSSTITSPLLLKLWR